MLRHENPINVTYTIQNGGASFTFFPSEYNFNMIPNTCALHQVGF